MDIPHRQVLAPWVAATLAGLLALSLVVGVYLAAWRRSSPFAGQWSGSFGNESDRGTFSMRIEADGSFVSSERMAAGVFNYAGKIQADGTATTSVIIDRDTAIVTLRCVFDKPNHLGCDRSLQRNGKSVIITRLTGLGSR